MAQGTDTAGNDRTVAQGTHARGNNGVHAQGVDRDDAVPLPELAPTLAYKRLVSLVHVLVLVISCIREQSEQVTKVPSYLNDQRVTSSTKVRKLDHQAQIFCVALTHTVNTGDLQSCYAAMAAFKMRDSDAHVVVTSNAEEQDLVRHIICS